MLQLSFVNYKKGSYILVEGNTDNSRFYIIKSGRAQVFTETGILDQKPIIYGPGDFLGVIPCMSGHSQIESAVALTDVVLISVRKDQYPELIVKNTPVALKIIKTFANRTRTLNEILMKQSSNASSSDTLTQLYNVAQFYDQTGKLNLATYCYYQYIKYCPTGEYIESARKRFIKLKPITQAVYFEIPKESVRKYPKDTMIFCENQEGREMFIIQQGQVKISKVVKNQELIFAVLKKGDFFGEMALLENKPRSASAIAHDDCVLMSVNAENFNQLVTTQPQLVARLTTTLADRLWSMYRQIANTKILDPVCKIFDMLALQVEKEKLVENGNKSYQFELTMQDLMNMCSIPQMEQRPVALKIKQSTMIKINEGKLFVTDCKELVSMASKFRKQKN